MNLQSYSKGLSVVEVVVGATIILILTVAIASAWKANLKVSRISNEKIQAALLLEEAYEAISYLRDGSWTSNILPLSLNTPYYLNWNGTTYIATTSTSTIQNMYIRTVTFSSVIRDGQDNISNSGIVDTKTRKVTISVSTNQNQPEVSVQAEMLIHNVFNN